MANLVLYKEDGIDWDRVPGIEIIKSTDPPPIGFSTFTIDPTPGAAQQAQAQDAISKIEEYCIGSGSYDYKTVRDCIKYLAETYNISNETTAKHNIGTGAQIIAAVPDNELRDTYSLEYIEKMRGGNKISVRHYRVNRIEALFWSRCKHIMLTNPITGQSFSMPELIFDMLNIKTPVPGEIPGNLLSHYMDFGLQGRSAGDGLVGVYDAFTETPGTRFAPWHPTDNPLGGGFYTHPLLQLVQPAGFASNSLFMDYVQDVIKYGLNPIA